MWSPTLRCNNDADGPKTHSKKTQTIVIVVAIAIAMIVTTEAW